MSIFVWRWSIFEPFRPSNNPLQHGSQSATMICYRRNVCRESCPHFDPMETTTRNLVSFILPTVKQLHTQGRNLSYHVIKRLHGLHMSQCRKVVLVWQQPRTLASQHHQLEFSDHNTGQFDDLH